MSYFPLKLINCILILSIGGCASTNSSLNTKTLSFKNKEDINCKVDSKIYSHGFKTRSNGIAYVPIKDGTNIILNWSKPDSDKVLVNGGKSFGRCYAETPKIKNISEAKNIFSEARISKLDRFVGAEFAVCTTVDEKWYFFIKENIGYIANTGASILPLALVGMSCN